MGFYGILWDSWLWLLHIDSCVRSESAGWNLLASRSFCRFGRRQWWDPKCPSGSHRWGQSGTKVGPKWDQSGTSIWDQKFRTLASGLILACCFEDETIWHNVASCKMLYWITNSWNFPCITLHLDHSCPCLRCLIQIEHGLFVNIFVASAHIVPQQLHRHSVRCIDFNKVRLRFCSICIKMIN